jgi:hypothetical protein
VFALFCRPQLITGTENLLLEFKGWAFLISGIDSAIDVFHARSNPVRPVDWLYFLPIPEGEKGRKGQHVDSEPGGGKDWTYLPPTPERKRQKLNHVSFGPSGSSGSSVHSDPRKGRKGESSPEEDFAYESDSTVTPPTPRPRPPALPKTTPGRRDLVDE